MEPWPNSWIIAVGLGIVMLAVGYMVSQLRRQERAKTWAVVVENERREARANEIFPDSAHFTVTVDDYGLVVRMEPSDDPTSSISFAPDVTSHAETVSLGSGLFA